MISWYYAIISVVIAVALYAYIDKRTKERDWGDGMEGMWAERAWDALLKLDKYKTHVKNWRPKYLVLGAIDENWSNSLHWAVPFDRHKKTDFLFRIFLMDLFWDFNLTLLWTSNIPRDSNNS